MEKEAGTRTMMVDNKRKRDVLHVYNLTLWVQRWHRSDHLCGYSLGVEKVEALTEQHGKQHAALREAGRKGRLRKDGMPWFC